MATAGQQQAASEDPVIRQLVDDGIYLGITAWTQLAQAECGAFYPSTPRSPEERLRYYAARYPITEVDSAFYHPPTERTTALWAERTPPGFVFDEGLSAHPAPDAT